MFFSSCVSGEFACYHIWVVFHKLQQAFCREDFMQCYAVCGRPVLLSLNADLNIARNLEQ